MDINANNVKINIKGIHCGDDLSREDIALETIGSYYYKNGKHYIRYEEHFEDERVSKNILKLEKGKAELIRKGYGAAHLCFETGNTNYTYYETLMGKLLIGVNTGSIYVKVDGRNEKPDKIEVKIEYEMIMDGEKTSNIILEIMIIML